MVIIHFTFRRFFFLLLINFLNILRQNRVSFSKRFDKAKSNKGDDVLALLCMILTVACIIDYLQNKIPNEILVILFVAGIGWRIVNEGPAAMLFFLAGAAGVTALLYPLYKIGCIGAGDVKLLGICSGWLTFQKILSFLFFSLLIAAAFSLLKMITKQNVRERFYYLWEYIVHVMKSGKWQLYFEDGRLYKNAGICLSGPVLLSVLLYIGGIY